MITRSADRCQTPAWKRSLARAFSRPRELLEFLDLDPALFPGALGASQDFSLRVPRGYAALMEKGKPDDPLLRQVMPVAQELLKTPGYAIDPVGDLAAIATPGLLQKYQGRALVIATGACAIHCRYCFRRHFPYGEHSRQSHLVELMDRLDEHQDVTEVILSGGDPLMLDDGRLTAIVRRLESSERFKRLRIHTRLPVVLPERVTEGLCRLLSGTCLKVAMVIHANHPRELQGQAPAALERLRATGMALLNQSVLLRGVNDSTATLQALSERLFDTGVIPYYIHLLDRVQGSGHFAVSEHRAAVLVGELRNRLSGYLVPRLVKEQTNHPSKTLIL